MARSGFGRGRGAERVRQIRYVAIALAVLSIAGVGLLAIVRQPERRSIPMVNLPYPRAIQTQESERDGITLTGKDGGTVVIGGDTLAVIKEVVEAMLLDDDGKIHLDKPPAMAKKALVVIDELSEDLDAKSP